MTIKIALVGSGYMANEYAKAVDLIDSLELSGVFSRNETSSRELSQEHGRATLAKSVFDLYEKTKADAVIVCVPEGIHIECYNFNCSNISN